MSRMLRLPRRVASFSGFLLAAVFLSGLAGGRAVLRSLEPVASALKTPNLVISYIHFDVFEPLTGHSVWRYAGSRKEPFYTADFGSQQRLANGKTLITESHNGRAIDVTAGGQIVWEYRHPMRQIVDKPPDITIVFEVLRIDPADLAFLGDAARS